MVYRRKLTNRVRQSPVNPPVPNRTITVNSNESLLRVSCAASQPQQQQQVVDKLINDWHCVVAATGERTIPASRRYETTARIPCSDRYFTEHAPAPSLGTFTTGE
jgi:hypothetical protein